MSFFYEYPFLIPLVTLFICHLFKFITASISEGKLVWYKWIAAGGMPSSHTALMSSVVTSIAIIDSISSTLFALSLVLATIVMHDAFGVRFHAGKQAEILNKIINSIFKNDHPLRQLKKLREVIGHKPLEVVIGALIGIIVAYILLNI